MFSPANAIYQVLIYPSMFIFLQTIGLYLAEISDKEIRGSTALITRFMFNFGILLIMCIGPSVSYTTLNYMLLALPISYFIVNLWIPESPYYCLMKGKVDAAQNVLRRIRSRNDKVSHIYFCSINMTVDI